mmetsp:Transcript_17362/g.44202  ORF Transcript_17362/g.44202 Transcript_17362/m.44202 type:complete len:260 (+) Transcript_17362:336-1115(+)
MPGPQFLHTLRTADTGHARGVAPQGLMPASLAFSLLCGDGRPTHVLVVVVVVAVLILVLVGALGVKRTGCGQALVVTYIHTTTSSSTSTAASAKRGKSGLAVLIRLEAMGIGGCEHTAVFDPETSNHAPRRIAIGSMPVPSAVLPVSSVRVVIRPALSAHAVATPTAELADVYAPIGPLKIASPVKGPPLKGTEVFSPVHIAGGPRDSALGSCPGHLAMRLHRLVLSIGAHLERSIELIGSHGGCCSVDVGAISVCLRK